MAAGGTQGDQLEWRVAVGGRGRQIAGALAAYVLLALSGVVAVAVTQSDYFFLCPAVGMGAVVLTLSLLRLFARQEIHIDRSAGRVERRGTPLFGGRADAVGLSQFDHVAAVREVRMSSNSDGEGRESVHYRVELRGESNFELLQLGSAADARWYAERLAKFLHWDEVDLTGKGDPVRRSPEQLDESLRQRAARTGERPSLPDSVAHRRIEATLRPAAGLIHFKPPHAGWFFGVSAGALVALAFLAWFATRPGMSDGELDTFGALWAAWIGPIAAGPLWVMVVVALGCTFHQTVRVDAHGLEVERSGLLWPKRVDRIEGDALEGIGRIDNRAAPIGLPYAVYARSDDHELQLGMGFMDPKIARWIRDTLLYYATQP